MSAPASEAAYPEHARLEALAEEFDLVWDALQWLTGEAGYVIAELDEYGRLPEALDPPEMLAQRFFRISEERLARERTLMLAAYRTGAQRSRCDGRPWSEIADGLDDGA